MSVAGTWFLTHATGVGVGVAVAVGLADGEALGDADGEADGEAEGDADGDADGEADGEAEGDTVGEAVGVTEGVGDGVPVTSCQTASKGLIWVVESTAVSVGLSNVGTVSPPRIIDTVPVGDT